MNGAGAEQMRIKLKALVADARPAKTANDIAWGFGRVLAAAFTGAALAQSIVSMVPLSGMSAVVFGLIGFFIGLDAANWLAAVVEKRRLRRIADRFRQAFPRDGGKFDTAFARLAALDSDGATARGLMLALAGWVRIAEAPASRAASGAPPSTLPPLPLDALPPLPALARAATGDSGALPLQPCAPDDPAPG